MPKRKAGLAAALHAQTSRLQLAAREKEREKAKLAAKAVAAAAGPSKARRAARASSQAQKQRAQKGVVPFQPTDRVLLIGEGDFSFALALVRHPTLGIVPANIVATTLDAEDALEAKYPDSAPANLLELRRKGVTVLCGVDATRLAACKALRKRTFDRIVWNFPHVGKGIADQDRNVRENQETLLAFLAAVPPFLERGPMPSAKRPQKYRRVNENEDNDEDEDEDEDGGGVAEHGGQTTRGTVLITLRDAPPYTLWDLPGLAKRPADPDAPRYAVVRSFAFARADWAALGYAHRMTKGHVDGIYAGGLKRAETVNAGERTWEFALADAAP